MEYRSDMQGQILNIHNSIIFNFPTFSNHATFIQELISYRFLNVILLIL